MRRLFAFLLIAITLIASPVSAQTQPAFSPEQVALTAKVDADVKTLQGWYAWYQDTTHAGTYTHPEFTQQIIEYKGKYNAALFYETTLRTRPKTLAIMAGPSESNFDVYYSGGSPVDVKIEDTIEFYRDKCVRRKKLIEKAGGIMLELSTVLKSTPLPSAVLNDPKDGLDNLRDSIMLNASNAVGTGSYDACMIYAADIYYVFHKASGSSGPDNAFMCIANFLIDKTRAPDPNGDGTCVEHRVTPWNWGKPPGCILNCSSNQSLPLQNASGYPVFYPRYFMMEPADRPSPTNPQGGQDLYTKAIIAIDGQLDFQRKLISEATSKLVQDHQVAAKAAADAEEARIKALTAELQARGTALSLPLPLSDITIPNLIGRILNTLLGIVGAVALLLFTWGGIRWMTAAGNQEQIGKAKSTITWAAIGLVAIFSAYAILNLVIDTFK